MLDQTNFETCYELSCLFLIFVFYFLLCVIYMEGHACATACVWKLKDIFVKFVLSYLNVGSRNRTHGSGHWTLGCYSEPFYQPFHVFGGNFCIWLEVGFQLHSLAYEFQVFLAPLLKTSIYPSWKPFDLVCKSLF